MYIKRVSVVNFRNYSEESAEFSEKLNMIIGENAQGKTNLLESIYFTSFGKSFRSSRDRDMIKIGKDFCRVSADYVKDDDELKVDVALSKEGKKAAKIDGRKVDKISELISGFFVVVFSPEDLKIVKEEPEKRRNFIDREICQLSFSYYNSLRDYKKILHQRNTYLKEPNINESLLEIWDDNLANEGSKIISKRKKFIDDLSGISEHIHSGITNGKEISHIEYDPSIKYIEDPEEQKKEFLRVLKEYRSKDLEYGNTYKGPHKDDIDIKIDGRSTRRFGSQGQQRTVALSMKLAEIELIKEEKGEYPILLLDDVFSELDEERQKYLLKYLDRMQVIITAAERPDELIEVFPDSNIININNGKILL